MTKNRPLEVVKVSLRLKEVLIINGKSVLYREGYSDSTIADEFSMTTSAVRHIRQMVYGKLMKGPIEVPNNKLLELEARINVLETLLKPTKDQQ